MSIRLSSILFEGMKLEPPEGYIVFISGDERNIRIRIRSKEKVITSRFPEGRYKSEGQMVIQPGIHIDDGGLVWEVENIVANEGYGPLLYDIAMEILFKQGQAGLMPDQIKVSDEARNVWRTYFEDRGDVDRKPLPEDLFVGKNSDRPEYLRYYYYKTSTPIIDDLKSKGLIESGDFEL